MMPLWAAIVLAAALVVSGRYGLRKLGTRRIEQHEKRLADRLAAGEDRYFEELRELEAYDPRRHSQRHHVIMEVIEMIAAFVVLTIVFRGLGS